MSSEVLGKTFRLFSDSNIKATFIVPLPNILLMNQRQTYNITFNYLPHDTFATLSVVMYFQRKFHLAHAINDVIQRLQSAGLIEYWHYSYYKKVNVETARLTKLSIAHLNGAFRICIGGCTIASVVFIIELLLHKMNKRI